MNPNTIALVRNTWKQVEAMAPAAAALFYQNLFEADPGLRRLFKGDLQRQGEKLMQMLGAAVGALDDLPRLVPALQSLAERHTHYGVEESHYQTVGAALLKTLRQGLAADFTPAVGAAWSEVYGMVADVMVVATRRGSGTAGNADRANAVQPT